MSQVRCNFLLRDSDDIVIVGGSPAGSSYGSPTGNPSFNVYPVDTGYGSPEIGPEPVVDSYGSPVASVDSIFYGSTQGSSFGRNPGNGASSSHNPFIPSRPIGGDATFVVGSSHPVPINDDSVGLVVDSYGAPVGPVISVFDPQRPGFEPEIITGRPNFVLDPQLDGHRPDFGSPASDSYGSPLGPVQTSRPPFRDPGFSNPTQPDFDSGISVVDSYGAPQAPVVTGRPPFNPGPDFNEPSDSYGAPQAPVVTGRPPFNPGNTPRPDYNPPSDGYGAPQGPIITVKPSYRPTGRPHYRPRPGKGGPNFLGPIASIIDAKRRAVANILHGFRAPKFFGGGGRGPQFKLPFIGGFGGFGKGKGSRRPRPSSQPSPATYGPPQPPPSYEPPRPTYRPPRKANPEEFPGDPRVEDRNDSGSETVIRCGDPGLVPETYLREFVFRSPGYPDNYPDSFNCSFNIFPRKDVCALGLELVTALLMHL